jgi:hypothetical protein
MLLSEKALRINLNVFEKIAEKFMKFFLKRYEIKVFTTR